jgi:hypothetical protein
MEVGVGASNASKNASNCSFSRFSRSKNAIGNLFDIIFAKLK